MDRITSNAYDVLLESKVSIRSGIYTAFSEQLPETFPQDVKKSFGTEPETDIVSNPDEKEVIDKIREPDNW